MKKLIRYRIAISRTFPATHKRYGEPTFFVEKIWKCQYKNGECPDHINDSINRYTELFKDCELLPYYDTISKKHTIRGNYELWAKRFEKIMHGEAVLELYYWSGKPYRSKAVTICQLGKDDGIGIQDLWFRKLSLHLPTIDTNSSGKYIIPNIESIAENDGLSHDDFKEWFKNYDLSKPMAIIHFTKFRY